MILAKIIRLHLAIELSITSLDQQSNQPFFWEDKYV